MVNKQYLNLLFTKNNYMPRMFFAIEVPDELKDQVISLQRDIKECKIKLVERKNLHITLSFFGDVDEEKMEALKKFDFSRFLPIHIKTDKITFFPNKNFVRVVSLNVIAPKIKLLQAFLREELPKMDLNPSFSNPHITLGRVKQVFNKDIFLSVEKKQINYSFVCNEIVLFKSKLTPNGPVYRKVKVFH